MFGAFLTWMQETETSVMVMATANDISKLPPELVRAGRFDATFFVDVPSTPERVEIIKIMNRRYNSNIPISYGQKLSEIEQLAKDSLYDGLDTAYDAIVPLSRTMREDIQKLKDWAKNRARPANTPEDKPKGNRKLRAVKKV
jgi:SpoVK/Ycf46/Vps4 family AAA+-type ATPase